MLSFLKPPLRAAWVHSFHVFHYSMPWSVKNEKVKLLRHGKQLYNDTLKRLCNFLHLSNTKSENAGKPLLALLVFTIVPA